MRIAIIAGVDPYAITGYGVVRRESATKFTVLGYGAITTPPDLRMDQRLKVIYGEMRRLIDEFQPHWLAVEQLFFNTNVTTALTVGQARGVVILAGAHSSVDIAEYTPLQVKLAVNSTGRQRNRWDNGPGALGLKEVPLPDDVADALAVTKPWVQLGKWSDGHDRNAIG